MQLYTALLALASLYVPYVNAAEAVDMGPAAFLWPPDRAWGAAQDNTAPCGSSAGVTNRTEFPLTNGEVSIVLQDESYNVNLAISYSNNPTSNTDFTTLVPSTNFPDLDPGHECYSVPNPPSNITSGANATLQLSYLSTFDTEINSTFYACADITYVPLASFTTNVLCFNVSEPTTTGSSPSSSSATSTSSSNRSSSSSSSRGGGLSGGQIAGIVVGCVAGAALAAVALFVLWTRYQRKVQRDKVVAVRMSDWANQPGKTVSNGSNEV
ncbi:hypothetical protein N7499_011491 [Penicillium canescens]|uniref:Copper acquisition factor BIM1-like domain-containing protein n=1 Tax=Penicillium canescens TaxID=5083 RepID=A0AAD6NDW4_PENCN|nr:uncharacterized protein N7446_006749 [Penicillium canescens]KAJ5990946.1 hypothetical protein N7522_011153 [Penicillium canescens]KAJ6049924.1 hypothetical protein N7444_006640 [Penicillium canescens]KAJ6052107.1 hypothetical protein N7460_002641 [Penicillium canescens]KAJ6062629.1 hypothetical protein N7446_006749 [Penicillium canescens]KAJ6069604.1 hypothetical protein N7499_011491 [Penicillium canescens]